MNQELAKERFEQANSLYQQGQYEYALDIYNELNQFFPNTKNILYPAALCMEKLGRYEEAKLLCHSLIARTNDEKLQRLLESLDMAAANEEEERTEAISLLKSAERAQHDAEEKRIAGISLRNRFILTMVISAVVLLLLLPISLAHSGVRISFPELYEGLVEVGLPLLTLYILAAFFTYLGLCYIMKCICEKAGAEPGFFIWIPFINVIPIMATARMSLLWLLVLFVPGLGLAFFLIIFWMKMCDACEEPKWLGVLVLFPGFIFLLPLYLAFSK